MIACYSNPGLQVCCEATARAESFGANAIAQRSIRHHRRQMGLMDGRADERARHNHATASAAR
jgi:hypothetical protein